MYNFIGFILAVIFIKMAVNHLGVDSNFYIDDVAILIVFGGTLATLVISFPPSYLIKFLKSPLDVILFRNPNLKKTATQLVTALQDESNRKAGLKNLAQMKTTDPYLKEGIELYLLDMPIKDFKNIMTERIYRARQREEHQVNLFRRLAKYPPAFGLVGTVLGLVALMRSVGEGADPSQIGLNMALALVATLYGLATSNFLIAPLSELFQHRADENKVYRELLLESLLLCYDQVSSLSVQEMLNSYLDVNQRIDVLGVHNKDAA
jgi:chemotaxis protein MotA